MVDTFAGAKYTGTFTTGNARRSRSLAVLEANGVEIPWLASGPESDSPIVLISGMGWRATGSLLASHFDTRLPLVALDYPRRWPRRRLDSMAEIAAVYAEALRSLGLTRVRLAGVSMGGMVALQLALDRPELVSSLAVVSTAAAASRVAGRWRVPASRLAAAFMSETTFYHFYRRWGPVLVGSSFFASPRDAAHLWTDPMSRRKMKDLLRAVSTFDVTRRLHGLRAPTLVVQGTQDLVFVREAAVELVEAIPDAQLVSVDGAGHFAFLTHQETVRAALERFWAATAGRTTEGS
jgi:pimeloyl-ACP methyl ester carboxylesterase